MRDPMVFTSKAQVIRALRARDPSATLRADMDLVDAIMAFGVSEHLRTDMTDRETHERDGPAITEDGHDTDWRHAWERESEE